MFYVYDYVHSHHPHRSDAEVREDQAKINRLTGQLALARRNKDKHRIREIEREIADLKRS
jgi:hypothetical protein